MLFDSYAADLFCQDEKWQELDDDDEAQTTSDNNNEDDEDDGDEELEFLFCKEKETSIKHATEPVFHSLRKKTVEWIVKVNAHYGFSALTAVLAVNYLDRFASSLSVQGDKKPWMMQLAAVACLSLAAKVEETHVPLLLDLQVSDAEYMFEAKTIQRMELLVLSALQWRMNPVTPLSFLDHVVRRLGSLKGCYVHWKFLRRYENLLLFIVSDSRFVRYLPSVLATATMLHVIHGVERCNVAIDYENQLLGVLNKVSKEEVDDCYELITDILSRTSSQGKNNHPLKRKNWQDPTSPSAMVEAIFSSDDSSDDSWEVQVHSSSLNNNSPSYNSKKRRVQEQQMKLPSLSRSSVLLNY